MFFINGYTDTKKLLDKNINIWTLNTSNEFISKNNKTYQNGESLLYEYDMGPMYGYQWRHYNEDYNKNQYHKINNIINNDNKNDQLINLLHDLLEDPFSRRLIITSYNPLQVHLGVLYPCHSLIIQLYVRELNDRYYVSLQMYQRSADLFLGLPFNIASMALLLHIIVDWLNKRNDRYEVDEVIICLGDCHIYQSHLNAVIETIFNDINKMPTLKINNNKIKDIGEYTYENIDLINYHKYKLIKAKMIP
jgi:thymidylate synthase